MERRQGRRFSSAEKLGILEEGRHSGAGIREVCRRHQIASSQFYTWEKRAREGALQALSGKGERRAQAREEAARAEIERLRAVIAELSSENLRLKKGDWG
jgi:transposase